MKNLKNYLSVIAVCTLLFSSCTTDSNDAITDSTEKATLSIGPILHDFETNRVATKDHLNFLEGVPGCSNEGDASYVEIILSQGGDAIVGEEGNPFSIDLVEGEMFTQEVAELELIPGNYSLDHFAVYNSDGELIWIAPTTNGGLEDIKVIIKIKNFITIWLLIIYKF